MTTDNVQVNSSTGVDGNSFTTSISNDQLTNDDFLQLMITELKLQDPTKPMDSQQMLATQMQMSTINTNQETIKAMQALTTAFAQSSLSNAANVIGKNVEDGNLNEAGINKAYTVRSVENINGEIQVRAQEILYIEDKIKLVDPNDSTKDKIVEYNVNGELLDENGKATGEKIALQEPGKPLLRDGKLVILDANNEELSSHNYERVGASVPVYSDQLTNIPFSTITKIF